MIPRDYITEWREYAPWVQDFQVEQDLIISRAVVEIFSSPILKEALAFRGGTALYKLHLKPAARYSDDIDLVQTKAEPAGPMMDALQSILRLHEGHPVTRAQFEKNFALKLKDKEFVADMSPLLAQEYEWDPAGNGSLVSSRLIARLPGEPWKGDT